MTPHSADRLGPEQPRKQRFGMRWWLPLHWTTEILHTAQAEGLINRQVKVNTGPMQKPNQLFLV